MDVGTICLGLFAFGCIAGLLGLVIGVEVSARRMKRIVPTVVRVPADEER